MRHLILMRHATAVNLAQNDKMRPLTETGRLQARARGSEYAGLSLPLPQVILCSPAQRTRETCSLFIEGSGLIGVVPTIVESFYHGEVEVLCEALEGLSSNHQCVFLIGHNPTWSQAVGYFSGEWPALAPADLAILTADAQKSWSDLIGSRSWNLKQILT